MARSRSRIHRRSSLAKSRSSDRRSARRILWGNLMALINVGSTTHYSISYDDSLSQADGLTRAQQLLGVCEQDYELMASWFCRSACRWPSISYPGAMLAPAGGPRSLFGQAMDPP